MREFPQNNLFSGFLFFNMWRYFVQNCLLRCTGMSEPSVKGSQLYRSPGPGWPSLMMEAVRTYETLVDNHFTQQYVPEDNSEHHTRRRENLKSHRWR
jgi:hypothetical protein